MRASSVWTRPAVFYLVLVAVPTAAIAGLSLLSLRREVRAIQGVADLNRRLLAEEFAAEVERDITERMDTCLHSADIRNLAAARTACPEASQVFLFEDGRIRYPVSGEAGDASRLGDAVRFGGKQPGISYPFAYAEGKPAQFFYMKLPGAPPDRVIAARVNLDYVRSGPLRASRRRMDIIADVVPRGSSGKEEASAFRVLFPFWTVSVRGGQGVESGYHNLVLYGALNIIIIFALGASVSQLLRLYSRQWRTAELRSTLVSRFSHELKTPLANIRLYADLLRNGNSAKPDDTGFAGIIAGQAEQLARRVNKVLDATLIDQGRRRYDLREADLSRIVAQTTERYRDWIAQQGFTLEAEIGPVEPVQCDPEAVAEILINLLEDALKYSGSSRTVGVAVQQDEGAAVVEVEDHGVGIPWADRARIFEEFYRAPNATKSGGFGLGLFLVRHAMDAHGGTIEVESEPGRGSRFRLRFPTHANDPDR